MTNPIAIKPFIDALQKFNIDDEDTYHLSYESFRKLKTINNKINEIRENYEIKGWLDKKQHQALQSIYKNIDIIQKQDSKSNGDSR